MFNNTEFGEKEAIKIKIKGMNGETRTINLIVRAMDEERIQALEAEIREHKKKMQFIQVSYWAILWFLVCAIFIIRFI